MLRFHSVGMILYRGLFFLSPWCASGRCLSPVRSRKGRGVPPAAASSQLHTASFASCARSYVLGRWMDGQLGGLGIFWCICKRSLPLGKQHGNRESSIYIYIHDRFSSKPRLIAGGYEHVRTTFLDNSCLTCAWDERKWPGMVRGIHGWNIPVLNNTPATRSVLSHPGASKRGILGARH